VSDVAAIEGPGFCAVQKNRKDKSLVSLVTNTQTDRHTDHPCQISKKSQIIWEEAVSPSLPLHCAHPHKNAPLAGSCSPFTTSYLRRNRPATPNGISIDSAVFAKYTFVTNGQTDRHGTQPVPIAAALAFPSASTLPRC